MKERRRAWESSYAPLAAARWTSAGWHALAWAVFAGGVAQLALQVPFLARIGLLPRFRINLGDAALWRILRQMGPAVFGVSISQVSLVINVIFASFLVKSVAQWPNLFSADSLSSILHLRCSVSILVAA